MTSRRTPKAPSRAASAKRARRRTTSTRRRAATTSRRSASRRSRPALSTTIGTALGTLVVTTLLDLSWPARLALIALVLVVGFAYVVWRQRNRPVSPPDTAAAAQAETADESLDDTAAQGDPTNE